eukprot:5806733-Pyramimonas_sp.AAC.3
MGTRLLNTAAIRDTLTAIRVVAHEVERKHYDRTGEAWAIHEKANFDRSVQRLDCGPICGSGPLDQSVLTYG